MTIFNAYRLSFCGSIIIDECIVKFKKKKTMMIECRIYITANRELQNGSLLRLSYVKTFYADTQYAIVKNLKKSFRKVPI